MDTSDEIYQDAINNVEREYIAESRVAELIQTIHQGLAAIRELNHSVDLAKVIGGDNNRRIQDLFDAANKIDDRVATLMDTFEDVSF